MVTLISCSIIRTLTTSVRIFCCQRCVVTLNFLSDFVLHLLSPMGVISSISKLRSVFTFCSFSYLGSAPEELRRQSTI